MASACSCVTPTHALRSTTTPSRPAASLVDACLPSLYLRHAFHLSTCPTPSSRVTLPGAYLPTAPRLLPNYGRGNAHFQRECTTACHYDSLHPCATAWLHCCCTAAPLHYCTVALLHRCSTHCIMHTLYSLTALARRARPLPDLDDDSFAAGRIAADERCVTRCALHTCVQWCVCLLRCKGS